MPPPFRKPNELLGLRELSASLFGVLKETYRIDHIYTLNLSSVDAARDQLVAVQDVAALTMRRLQALRLIATPGHRTTSDVIIGTLAQLIRPLEELAAHVGGDDEWAAAELTRAIPQIGRAAVAVGEIGGEDFAELI